MRITFLGTSHGVPEPNRKCSCTMIEVAGNVYFIDMGTPAIDALRTRMIEVDAVKGVFITHMHGDHSNGLISFVDIVNWYFRSADPDIVVPDLEAYHAIKNWLEVTKVPLGRKIRFRETTPGLIYDDGLVRLTAFLTQHCVKSYAYLVEAEGKTVLFTGDLRNPNVDFPEMTTDTKLDLVVCEAAHFEATDYLPRFLNKKIGKVCVNHYSDRYLPSVFSLFAAVSDMKICTVLATDDLEIVV